MLRNAVMVVAVTLLVAWPFARTIADGPEPYDGISLSVDLVEPKLPPTNPTRKADSRDVQYRPTFISIRLHNGSAGDLQLWRQPDDFDIQLKITDADGTDVPLTKFGRRVWEAGRASLAIDPDYRLSTLSSDMDWTYEINLSRRADITLRGTYFVQALRILNPVGTSTSIAVSSQVLALDIDSNGVATIATSDDDSTSAQ